MHLNCDLEACRIAWSAQAVHTHRIQIVRSVRGVITWLALRPRLPRQIPRALAWCPHRKVLHAVEVEVQDGERPAKPSQTKSSNARTYSTSAWMSQTRLLAPKSADAERSTAVGTSATHWRVWITDRGPKLMGDMLWFMKGALLRVRLWRDSVRGSTDPRIHGSRITDHDRGLCFHKRTCCECQGRARPRLGRRCPRTCTGRRNRLC